MASPSPVARDRLVTGEAVVVELPVAGVGLRAMSGVLDLFLETLLLVGLARLLEPVMWIVDGAGFAAVALTLMVVCFVGVPVTCETLFSRTPGKVIFRLRTVRDDGGPIDLRRALARHLVGFVEIIATVGLPAFVAGILTTPTRRLGDIAAGTLVARDRIRMPQPQHTPAPPAELAAWAAAADLSALPDVVLLRARASLLPNSGLTSTARAVVAERLLHEIDARLVPPPPPGADPAAVLLAILAERRARDAQRLARDERLRARHFPAAAGGGRPVRP